MIIINEVKIFPIFCGGAEKRLEKRLEKWEKYERIFALRAYIPVGGFLLEELLVRGVYSSRIAEMLGVNS